MAGHRWTDLVEIICELGRIGRCHRLVVMMDCCGHDLSPAVALFRSLGDQARLAIVLRLAVGEARVLGLIRQLGLAQSTVSKDLACLRDCRLIDCWTEG